MNNVLAMELEELQDIQSNVNIGCIRFDDICKFNKHKKGYLRKGIIQSTDKR